MPKLIRMEKESISSDIECLLSYFKSFSHRLPTPWHGRFVIKNREPVDRWTKRPFFTVQRRFA